VLVIDQPAGDIKRLAEQLDESFGQAHHYAVARRLGQLAPLQVRIAPAARDTFDDYFMSKGMKWGDIKPQFLIRNLEDAAQLLARFEASIVDRRALKG
jgi:hypothetical protein